MKLHHSSILIYTTFNLFHGVTALPAPGGLNIAVGFLGASFEGSALDFRLRQDLNAVQLPSKEICGGRGPCTNGATCIDEVCKCSPGWILDPLILPVFDAGWRSCVRQNECLALEMACNDANAACVDRDPPERFDCVCSSAPQRAAPPLSFCAALVCPKRAEFTSTYDLKTAIQDDTLEQSIENHGAINCWDVSQINDMTGMFEMTSFNEDICCWDVSQVTSMKNMLGTNAFFNQPVNNWDVSRVTDLGGSFALSIFNQPLNSWVVSKVTDMSFMFYQADNLNQPLSNWDVSKVTRFNWMFKDATAFNQPLNSWDVSKVTHMDEMFIGATVFNQPLNSWDVSEVVDVHEMFRGATVFNQPLNLWDVSHVTSMEEMFRGATLFDQDLCPWKGKLDDASVVRFIFLGTSCHSDFPDPYLNDDSSPFCHICEGETNED